MGRIVGFGLTVAGTDGLAVTHRFSLFHALQAPASRKLAIC